MTLVHNKQLTFNSFVVKIWSYFRVQCSNMHSHNIKIMIKETSPPLIIMRFNECIQLTDSDLKILNEYAFKSVLRIIKPIPSI